MRAPRAVSGAPAGAAALVLALAGVAGGQSLERRIAQAPDGEVRLSFAARPGVCGNGRNVISFDCEDGSCGRRRTQVGDWTERDDFDCRCEYGPVRVSLRVSRGTLTDLRTYVGGAWHAPSGPLTDLGVVGSGEAADYLLGVAARVDGKPGERAVFAATLADSADVAPALLRLARDERVARRTRRQAVFWLGHAAGQVATRGLQALVGEAEVDREVKESAVFALSQRPADQSVPVLIEIARTHADAEIRRKAIFWLGQKDDPRVLAFFEEILSVRRTQ